MTQTSQLSGEAKTAIPFGVNVAGYIAAESGVGTATRGYIRALNAAGIPVALNNFSVGLESRQADETFGGFSDSNPYAINLICVNADQLPAFVQHFGSSYFEGKYNIGVWWWELPEFPPQFWESFKWLDEIWVGSYFIQHALAPSSPLPVVRIPPALSLPEFKPELRANWGIAENDFVFLNMFDFFSGFERKNPLGLIRAFRAAFKPDEPVTLILKCINSAKATDKLQILRECIGDARIQIADHYLSTEQTFALVDMCDAYVSLHTAEGFGLPLADAMMLRKPAIGTGWSGNIDFMTAQNSYLVPYRLQIKSTDTPPYQEGEVWAEADEEQAAKLMRAVYGDRCTASMRGAQAAIDVRKEFDPQSVAALVKHRLAAIQAFHPSRIPNQDPAAKPFLLDDTTEKQLSIIATGSPRSESKGEAGKSLLRKFLMPIVERAGYLNGIYSNLFHRLFHEFGQIRARMDVIDSRVRRRTAEMDARIASMEDEIKRLRDELDATPK